MKQPLRQMSGRPVPLAAAAALLSTLLVLPRSAVATSQEQRRLRQGSSTSQASLAGSLRKREVQDALAESVAWEDQETLLAERDDLRAQLATKNQEFLMQHRKAHQLATKVAKLEDRLRDEIRKEQLLREKLARIRTMIDTPEESDDALRKEGAPHWPNPPDYEHAAVGDSAPERRAAGQARGRGNATVTASAATVPAGSSVAASALGVHTRPAAAAVAARSPALSQQRRNITRAPPAAVAETVAQGTHKPARNEVSLDADAGRNASEGTTTKASHAGANAHAEEPTEHAVSDKRVEASHGDEAIKKGAAAFLALETELKAEDRKIDELSKDGPEDEAAPSEFASAPTNSAAAAAAETSNGDGVPAFKGASVGPASSAPPSLAAVSVSSDEAKTWY